MLQSDLSGNGLVASESRRVSLIHNVFFVGVGKRNLKIRQVGHIGYQPRFSSIGDIKIAQEDDGRFVGNGYSCRLDSAIKAIGRRMGGDNGDRAVAITGKHTLQKIALLVFSRQTRAWSSALDVANDQGQFSNRSQTNKLALETHSRTTGCANRKLARKTGAQGHTHRSYFVFGLNSLYAKMLECGQTFQNRRCRGYGITCIE